MLNGKLLLTSSSWRLFQLYTMRLRERERERESWPPSVQDLRHFGRRNCQLDYSDFVCKNTPRCHQKTRPLGAPLWWMDRKTPLFYPLRQRNTPLFFLEDGKSRNRWRWAEGGHRILNYTDVDLPPVIILAREKVQHREQIIYFVWKQTVGVPQGMSSRGWDQGPEAQRGKSRAKAKEPADRRSKQRTKQNKETYLRYKDPREGNPWWVGTCSMEYEKRVTNCVKGQTEGERMNGQCVGDEWANGSAYQSEKGRWFICNTHATDNGRVGK